MIRLHHVSQSRSFRSLWLLTELGLDFEISTYQIGDGSLRAPEFLEISPSGRVPALEIDGTVLFESGAIAQYLCETRPESGLGRDGGHPERIQFLEWMHYAETMACLVQNLNLQWVFLRDPATRSNTVVKLEARRLAKTLDPLEAVLKENAFLLPSGFSAADTMLGFNLIAVPYYVRMDPYPNIRRYWAAITERPAFKAARAADGPQAFYSQEFYEVGSG